jgi:hypothetical protein
MVVALWANPGHLQFELFLLRVVMNEIDADIQCTRCSERLRVNPHSRRLHDCLSHRQLIELELFEFCLRQLPALAYGSTIIALEYIFKNMLQRSNV